MTDKTEQTGEKKQPLYTGVGLILGAAVGFSMGGPVGAGFGAAVGLLLGAGLDARQKQKTAPMDEEAASNEEG